MFIITKLYKPALRGISLFLTGALLLLSVPAYAVNTPKPNVDNLAATLATAPMCVVVPGVVDELSFHDKRLSGKEISYYDLRNSFKTRLFATKSHTVLPDQSDISFIINEIAENSYDAILDKIDKLDINPTDYDGRVVLKVYNDEQELVISCVDNGLTVEFDIFGTPESRARDSRRHFGGGHGAQKVMKKKLYGMSGKIKYIPLDAGTKVEIRIPRKSLPTKKYFSNNQRIIITDENAVARQMARVRREMISQAVTLSRVVYAEKDDPILAEADAKLLTHGKILVSPRLKNNPLKQLRAIFHEEIEAVMQILKRQKPFRYGAIREMMLSDERIRTAYSKTFPDNNSPDLEDNLLVNDMIATAFELLLLIENNLITNNEMTPAQREYIKLIRPVIVATKHNYFTSIFWDQYTREMEIRTAMASGQKFYEVASIDSEQKIPQEETESSQNVIDVVDLSQDARVIEIAEDLKTTGLQNFTKINPNKISPELREGGGFVGLFKHKNGLEIIQRRNYEEYVKKFFSIKRPWFCPVFSPRAGADENMLFELNLKTLGYQTFDSILDGKYKKGETRSLFQEEQKKRITNTIRHAIRKTFKADAEKSDHGHLKGANILVKIDDDGELKDVKIIDWKCIFRETLPTDLDAFVNGERENLKGADFTGSGVDSESGVEAYDFIKQDMTGANLKLAWINWADFNRTILRLADLSEAMALGASFILADLRGAWLVKCELWWADFEGADLRGADLTQAALVSACLRYAKLAGTILTRADLRRVDLTNVDLSEAILKDTTMDIKQADFFESQGYKVVRQKDRCIVTSPSKPLGAAASNFTKESDVSKEKEIEELIAKLDFQNDSANQAQINLDILQKLTELPNEHKTVKLAKKVVAFMDYKGTHKEAIRQAGKHFFETIPEDFLFDLITTQTVTEIEIEEFDPWALYQRDISNYPMLTRLGEITLGVRVQLGDMSARNKFIEANLRLVFHIITKKFSGKGTPTRDMLSSGYQGLIKAVGKFEPQRGIKFSTFASLLIRQAIQVHLQTEPKQVRIPLTEQDRIRIFKEKCLQAGLDPTDIRLSSSEIASAIEETVATVMIRRNEILRLISLDDPETLTSQYGNAHLENITGKQKTTIYTDEIENILNKVLTKLRLKWRKNYDRNKEILDWRLFGPLKTENERPILEDCAKHFNLKRERIRQIEQEGREGLVRALKDADMTAEYFAEGLRKLYAESLNATPKSLGAAARGFTKELDNPNEKIVRTMSTANEPLRPPATLLREMHINKIFAGNTKSVEELSSDNTHYLKTIQEELSALREAGLVIESSEGQHVSYYLVDWLRKIDDIDKLIESDTVIELLEKLSMSLAEQKMLQSSVMEIAGIIESTENPERIAPIQKYDEEEFEKYLSDNNLDKLQHLKKAFTPAIKSALLRDPVLKPVFLRALPDKHAGKTTIVKQISIAGEDIKDIITKHTVFKVGNPEIANILMQKGETILVGVTDRPAKKSKMLQDISPVANGRQAYFPLSDGTWLGIKGCGQFNDKNREPWYRGLDNRQITRYYGLAWLGEALFAHKAMEKLEGTNGRFVQMLGYRIIKSAPNGEGGFKSTTMCSVPKRKFYHTTLIFNRVATPHRLVKFPQLHAEDTELQSLIEDVSRSLAGFGLLQKGTILSPEELVNMMMRKFGQQEAIKQNMGLSKTTKHSQDYTFAGEEADNEELGDIVSHIKVFEEFGDHGTLGISQDLLFEDKLDVFGMMVRLFTVTDMLKVVQANQDDAEEDILFPEPAEVLEILFKSYFMNLEDKWLNMWAAETGAELSLPVEAAVEYSSLHLFHPYNSSDDLDPDTDIKLQEEMSRDIYKWANDEVLRREELRSRISETDRLLESFEKTCDILRDAPDSSYPLSAWTAEMTLSGREKEGESLILYADDILSSTMAVDLKFSIQEILSSYSTLKNGKIIIFAKNESAAEILNAMIMETKFDVETFIITKEKLKETKNLSGSQADEISALVNFARTKGATDILGLIKGASQQPEDLTEICKELEMPVLMIGHEEGLYSFARAIAHAANAKDSNGAEGWFIVLRPIQTISEDIKAMHQEYLSALQALISA